MDINAHLALARSGKQVPPKPAVLGSFFNFPRWFLWNSANKTVLVALACCTLWSLFSRYFLSMRHDFGLLRIFTSGNTRKCFKKMQPILQPTEQPVHHPIPGWRCCTGAPADRLMFATWRVSDPSTVYRTLPTIFMGGGLKRVATPLCCAPRNQPRSTQQT